MNVYLNSRIIQLPIQKSGDDIMNKILTNELILKLIILFVIITSFLLGLVVIEHNLYTKFMVLLQNDIKQDIVEKDIQDLYQSYKFLTLYNTQDTNLLQYYYQYSIYNYKFNKILENLDTIENISIILVDDDVVIKNGFFEYENLLVPTKQKNELNISIGSTNTTISSFYIYKYNNETYYYKMFYHYEDGQKRIIMVPITNIDNKIQYLKIDFNLQNILMHNIFSGKFFLYIQIFIYLLLFLFVFNTKHVTLKFLVMIGIIIIFIIIFVLILQDINQGLSISTLNYITEKINTNLDTYQTIIKQNEHLLSNKVITKIYNYLYTFFHSFSQMNLLNIEFQYSELNSQNILNIIVDSYGIYNNSENKVKQINLYRFKEIIIDNKIYYINQSYFDNGRYYYIVYTPISIFKNSNVINSLYLGVRMNIFEQFNWIIYLLLFIFILSVTIFTFW